MLARRYGIRTSTILAAIRAGELKALNLGRATRPRYRISESAIAEFEAAKSVIPQPALRPVRRTRSAVKVPRYI